MFEKGEYVVYGSKGVCQVQDISHVNIPGADKNRLYYVLHPVQDKSGTVYLPTDSQKVVIRKVMTKEEAGRLIEEIPQIEQLWIADDKKREVSYKEAMRTCSSRAWVSIIKALYLRRTERQALGKKITSLDERYLRAAEHELYSELSVALDVPKEKMENYIHEHIEKSKNRNE